MILAQFKNMKPISYMDATSLFKAQQAVFRIYEDGTESLLGPDDYPVERHLYAIERDEPLTLVHGDKVCSDWGDEVLTENDHCTLCGALVM